MRPVVRGFYCAWSSAKTLTHGPFVKLPNSGLSSLLNLPDKMMEQTLIDKHKCVTLTASGGGSFPPLPRSLIISSIRGVRAETAEAVRAEESVGFG